MLKTTNCYKVTHKATNSMGDTVNIAYDSSHPMDDKDPIYLSTEGGAVFVLADNFEEVGKMFPFAISIIRVGYGCREEINCTCANLQKVLAKRQDIKPDQIIDNIDPITGQKIAGRFTSP